MVLKTIVLLHIDTYDVRTFFFVMSLRRFASTLLVGVSLSVGALPSTVFAGAADTIRVTRADFIHRVAARLASSQKKDCALPLLRVPVTMKSDLCVFDDVIGIDRIWPGAKSILLDQPITRGEAIIIFTLLQAQDDRSIDDVSAFLDARTQLQKEAISTALKARWMRPLRHSIFGLSQPITRAEATTLFDALDQTPSPLSSDTLPDELLLKSIWHIVQRDYLRSDQINPDEVSYQSIEGMIRSLNDPYSTFFRPQQASDFASQIEGKVAGIGAHVAVKDSFVTIVAPIAGSPAEKAGLQTGDQVVSVDGITIVGMPLDKAVSLIRGDKGTSVTLVIRRAGEEKTVTIQRDIVDIPELDVTWMNGVALVTDQQFGDKTDAQIRDVFARIAENRPRGIILDLRNNPGGLLHAAVQMMSNFVPQNSGIVLVKGRYDANMQKTQEKPTIASDVPVVLLVNNGSASASEIVAGAMKDYKRATIVGSQTFGKGTVQEIIRFDSVDEQKGSALKLTVAEFFSPLGSKIDKVGITPDIPVDQGNDPTVDPPLLRALDILR